MSTQSTNLDDDGTFEEQRARVDYPMRRLFDEYGRENASPLLLGLLASIVAHTIALLPPIVLGVAVDAVFLQTAPYDLPLIPDAVVPETQSGQFWFSALLVGVAFLLSSVFAWVKGRGLNVFAQRVQHQVRSDTYAAMQDLDLDFFADKQTGELMSILNNDVNRLEQFLNGGLNIATQLVITVGGIAAVLLYLNLQLGLIALVTVPVIAVFTHQFVQRIQPLYADVRSTVGHLNSRLENNLAGIDVIKLSNTEEFEADRVDDSSQEYYDTNMEAVRTRIKFFPGLQLTAGVGFVLTFVVGGVWVFSGPPAFLSGSLSVGTFVTFVFLGQRLVWPMAQFGQLINLYQRAEASAERVFGLIDEPSHLAGDDDAPDLAVTSGQVVYDDVTFSYEGEDESAPVIEDISFTVDEGETVALVGPTGAGKSTVLKLLPRLYDVDAGSVQIDGQDIRDVDPGSLREAIGYVGQETFLFFGSVADNIRYGSFDASREDVIEAAKAAQAHEFIQDLDEGYDTEVGERGVKLSGGQRQRISIARVLLQDPDILILDEATSDVDTETELQIQEQLDALAADRTVLAIAHRLSTIKDADEILVLEDGSVVERGTHDELVGENGLYAKLWGVQAGQIDDAMPERRSELTHP
jgi:ATP-binding cassette subfamily B protein